MHFRLLGVPVVFLILFVKTRKLPGHNLISPKTAFSLMRCLQNSLGFWEDWQERQPRKIIKEKAVSLGIEHSSSKDIKAKGRHLK